MTVQPEAPLLALRDVGRDFDVSPPWLDRVLEGAPRRTLKAVDGVSLSIRRGETMALVGESGCGKSTVARLIVGLHAPSRGDIQFDGVDMAGGERAARARRRMQMIFQDPYASLNPRWRVARIVAEPLRAQGQIKGRTAMRRAGGGTAAAGRVGGRRRRQVSARVLRRAAPAHLHRAGAVGAPGVPRLRRADLGARRVGAGADPQPDEGSAGAPRAHLPVHLAQPGGGRLSSPTASASCISAGWSRWRTPRRLFSRPRHPYTRMLLDALPDLEMSGRARTPVAGEVPNPLAPALRLCVPPALPARQRALPPRAAGTARLA